MLGSASGATWGPGSLPQSQCPSFSLAAFADEGTDSTLFGPFSIDAASFTEMSRVPSPNLLYTVLSEGGRTSSTLGARRSLQLSKGLPRSGRGLVDRLRLLYGLSTLLIGLCGCSPTLAPPFRGDKGVLGVTGLSGEADGVRGGVSGGVRGPRLFGRGDRPVPFFN